jgi:WD40 repeat protein
LILKLVQLSENHIHFTPDFFFVCQKFIVSGGVNGEIRVWEVKSRELVAHLKEHNARVNAVAIFDDNLHVLSCSRDRSFLCWDLQQEKRVSSHIQRMGGINAMKLSKDQQTVLTAGQEKKITCVPFVSFSQRYICLKNCSVKFSASVYFRFWDLRKANPEQIISPAHDGEATCMAVSNDGTLFVTGGTDQRVKLWDFATGTCLADGVGHSNVVTAVEFAPDDRQIISTGLDGGIFVWNLFR